jgi:hypothetical protein
MLAGMVHDMVMKAYSPHFNQQEQVLAVMQGM